MFIGRADVEAEAVILWPFDAKSRLFGKDPGDGKDWRPKENGLAEDEIDSTTDSMDMNLSKLREMVKDMGAWCAAVSGVTKSQTWLSDSTRTTLTKLTEMLIMFWGNIGKKKFLKHLGRKIGRFTPCFCYINCQKTSEQCLHIFNGIRVMKMPEAVSRHAAA